MPTENHKPKGVTNRLNADGTENTNYVDVLDEDKSIGGQKFVCVSFLSPLGSPRELRMKFIRQIA